MRTIRFVSAIAVFALVQIGSSASELAFTKSEFSWERVPLSKEGDTLVAGKEDIEDANDYFFARMSAQDANKKGLIGLRWTYSIDPKSVALREGKNMVLEALFDNGSNSRSEWFHTVDLSGKQPGTDYTENFTFGFQTGQFRIEVYVDGNRVTTLSPKIRIVAGRRAPTPLTAPAAPKDEYVKTVTISSDMTIRHGPPGNEANQRAMDKAMQEVKENVSMSGSGNLYYKVKSTNQRYNASQRVITSEVTFEIWRKR